MKLMAFIRSNGKSEEKERLGNEIWVEEKLIKEKKRMQGNRIFSKKGEG